MSDIRAIKQNLKPWPSQGEPMRYYLNDWADRIYGDLRRRLADDPKAPTMDQLVRWAKVWFDPSGAVHVDGIYDAKLAAFIADTITDRVFTSVDYDPAEGAVEVCWPMLVDALPFREADGTYFFRYGGREYAVNTDVYREECSDNPAYIGPDGEIRFESVSTDLWDLVATLIRDNSQKEAERVREAVKEFPVNGDLFGW